MHHATKCRPHYEAGTRFLHLLEAIKNGSASKCQYLIAFYDQLMQVVHSRDGTHLGSLGLAQLEASAASQHFSTRSRQHLHLLGDLEFVGIQGLSSTPLSTVPAVYPLRAAERFWLATGRILVS